MGETFSEAQGLLFAEMDARAREVVEKKFRVRMDSTQSNENMQAAWEVYQNASVKLIKAIGSGVEFGDARGYAATVARNSCRDYWRVRRRRAPAKPRANMPAPRRPNVAGSGVSFRLKPTASRTATSGRG